MDAKKKAQIELVYNIGSDLPDGAWWALCADHGLDQYDLVEYWEEKGNK